MAMDNIESKLAKLEVAVEFFGDRLNELSDEIVGLREQMSRIETRLSAREVLNGTYKEDLDDTKCQVDDLKDTVELLKKYFWMGIGVVATVQVLLNYILY